MFLKVLEKLMSDNGLNKSKLSKQSGIAYTTIDGFYKKGCDNIKLSTLRQLASFFNVSLDYLITGENDADVLDEKELKLIKHYRELNDIGRNRLTEYMHLLSLDRNYKSYSDIYTQSEDDDDDDDVRIAAHKKVSIPPIIDDEGYHT